MNYNPKRSEEIRTTSLPDGHVVLINDKTNWAHTLTPIAALVWEFCDGTNSAEQIIEELRQIPEVEGRDQLKDEVYKLLNEFDEDGFVTAS